jgi:hypothetical protein
VYWQVDQAQIRPAILEPVGAGLAAVAGLDEGDISADFRD